MGRDHLARDPANGLAAMFFLRHLIDLGEAWADASALPELDPDRRREFLLRSADLQQEGLEMQSMLMSRPELRATLEIAFPAERRDEIDRRIVELRAQAASTR